MTAPSELLTGLLKEVSRSFYLTLRMLPGEVRRQIGLAYLLARATDTVADSELVPVEERLERLRALRERILGRRMKPLDFSDLSRQQGRPGERVLLARIETAIARLADFDGEDRTSIREVLATITSGQELDLQRFGEASFERIVALERREDLDDYTYRVAGCVGEFWTRICRRHLFPQDSLDDGRLIEDGVRFGKGLQLVNILRDLAGDLRQGRCYLPRSELNEIGLGPRDLLEPRNESVLRPVYERWRRLAVEHLLAGRRYTRSLPCRCIRLRLACTWPIDIGMETLEKLRTGTVLNAERRIKVSKSRVWGLVLRSVVAYPWSCRGQADERKAGRSG